MPITRIRGDLQIKSNTVESEAIKNSTIQAADIAPGSMNGAVFIDGSIPAEKIDVESLAGDGLLYNPTFSVLDVDADLSLLETFNGPNQLVKLDGAGKLPALDGSQLTGITGGGGGATFVDMAVPTGAINGSNTAFVLAQIPATGSLHLYLNGILLRPGVGNDYTLSGASIAMNGAPSTGSFLVASYRV